MSDNYRDQDPSHDAQILNDAAHLLRRYEDDLKAAPFDYQQEELRRLLNYQMKQVIETALLYIK